MAYVRIPAFQQAVPVVDGAGRFTPAALRSLNDAFKQLANALNAIAEIPEIQAALGDLDEATKAANAAAQAAQQATDASVRESALANSYIEPDSVLTADTTTITVAAHIRHYADGTTASVNGGTVAVTAPGDTDYVSYSDPQRKGGAVSYVASTSAPTQTGNTHVVGAVEVPTVGTAQGGSGPRRPGYVTAKFNNQPDE